MVLLARALMNRDLSVFTDKDFKARIHGALDKGVRQMS